MLSIALFAATAMVSEAADLHRVELEHGGAPVQVRYDARITTRFRQIGMSAGPRAGSERCLWTSHVAVERHIGRPGGAERISKSLPHATTFEGSRPGSCAAARETIARQVAARRDDVAAHVLAAADRDRATLRAELDAARTLAMN